MVPTTSNFKAEALTNDVLRLQAPSIFAERPMNGLSSRYTFVPTTEIIAGLREKSWLPVHTEQQRARSQLRFGFQKHLIRFRRAEQMQTLDEWNAELVLTNSHDAGCAYILQVGIFRRLCSNGLVVSDQEFEAIRFRHAHLRTEEVVAASFRILEYVPKLGALAEGKPLASLARRRHLNNSTLRYHKEKLALKIQDFMGPDILIQIRRKPTWKWKATSPSTSKPSGARPVEGFCYSASGLNIHPGQPVFDIPNLPLAGHVSQLGQTALGQPQFFPSLADAPTEVLA